MVFWQSPLLCWKPESFLSPFLSSATTGNTRPEFYNHFLSLRMVRAGLLIYRTVWLPWKTCFPNYFMDAIELVWGIQPKAHPIYTSLGLQTARHIKSKTYFPLMLLKPNPPGCSRHQGTKLRGYFPLPVEQEEHIRSQDFVRPRMHKPEHQITLHWKRCVGNSSLEAVTGRTRITVTALSAFLNKAKHSFSNWLSTQNGQKSECGWCTHQTAQQDKATYILTYNEGREMLSEGSYKQPGLHS